MTKRVPAVALGRAAEAVPRPGLRARAGITARARRAGPGARRRLQLILAGAWLVAGILQCQPLLFSRAFAGVRAETQSAVRRAAYLAGAPLIPIVLLARIAGRVVQKRCHVGKFVATRPRS